MPGSDAPVGQDVPRWVLHRSTYSIVAYG